MSKSLYELLELVERLESLREDMIDLEVESLTDIDARLLQLHRQIDDLPDEPAGAS
ncbi:MAG TPA: hypothetical protein VHL09_06660 [Dehalococcoidia bacterium]|nr:hypothetical protein [Dehalococcoidia bacterium]